jgi:type IV fimbrial biogenesis protein FimT
MPARPGGFTLVELMITLAIAGILLAIGIPSMRGFVLDGRISSAASDLSLALSLARTEAVKRGKSVTVLANGGGGASNEWGPGWVVFVDDDSDGVQDAGEESLRDFQAMPAAITVDSADDVTLIRYRSSGRTSDGALHTFNICDDRTGSEASGRHRQVTVSVTGQIATIKHACT